MKSIFSRILSFVLSLALVFSISGISGAFEIVSFAVDSDDIKIVEPQADINRDEDLPEFIEPEYVPMFSFPPEMRAVYVTPFVDYATTDKDGNAKTEDEIISEVDEMLSKMSENKMNTMIINSENNGDIFYNTNTNDTVEKSIAEYAINSAKEQGFYVYFNLNLGSALAEYEGVDFKERIDLFALHIHNLTVKYNVDGIILDGYYSQKNSSSLEDYLGNGSGIGFENWLYDNGAYIFSLAVDSIRKTNNAVSVGISINDVWANYESDENGSDTSVDFEALNDGYSDTLSYIKKGYADFVMLKANGARADDNLPFDSITSWWNEYTTSANIPLFVRHINENICTNEDGWISPDELVKQVVGAEELSSFGGSAFNSLDSLTADKMESTTVLMKHYDDTIDLEGLDSELEMTLPTKTTYTTEEPYAIFAGSFDPNFPLYFQGNKVMLNEAGRFYYKIPLEVGGNTFKFQNKAKVITYKITRTVTVLKSVEPSDSTMRVEEESTISLSAIAYKESQVSAEINGKSITLEPVYGQVDGIDPNSSYTKYVGNYTVPKGKKGEEVNLGSITFYGTYQTNTGPFNESKVGANVIINAVEIVPNDFSGNLLKVKSDNTEVYNYKLTSSTDTPDMARLPAGTLDYHVKTVTYDGQKYYLTNSGKRLLADDVYVLDNEPLGSNPISVKEVYKKGNDTVIKFGTNAKVPFAISYNGQSYHSDHNGDYYVSSFNATGITITFDYITSISASDITFPETSVFTSGSWSSSEIGETVKTRLNLNFRQAGIYSGVTADYDENGYLTFTFNGRSNSIDGSTIVIDPGHGYTGKESFDPGAVGQVKEQEVNLAISKYLESYLSQKGANVIRFKTESQVFVTEARARTARQYKPDIFISVHANATSSESTSGSEAYYFTPFSQPLAKLVTEEISAYMVPNVGTKGNRGDKYNIFWTTLEQDFASILVETGFVTNYTEAMALANPTHQQNIAKAIGRGIERYFGMCNYTSYGSGTGSFSNSATNEPLPTPDFVVPPEETVAPPEETLAPPEESEDETEETVFVYDIGNGENNPFLGDYNPFENFGY